MRFRVLGPLEVRHDGGSLDIGGRQPRLVLAALLAADGAPVATDALVDLLWGEDPPASAAGTLQTYMSRLRRALATTGVADPAIHHSRAGYRLPVAPGDLDLAVFEQLALQGEQLLQQHRPDQARPLFDQALALVRGPAWAEVEDHPAFEAVVARAREQYLAVRENRAAADLTLGRDSGLAAELAELVAQHPLRERPRAMLAVALYRAGRQADALATLAEGARLLRDELGIEPDRRLAELETRILQHDPTLDAVVHVAEALAAESGGDPSATGAPRTADGDGPPDMRPPAPGRSALVGRGNELAQLVAALDEAHDDARFVVVQGDPGIGKTRLVDELRELAEQRGCLAVWGRSDEGGAAPALWPWLPILRALDERVEAGLTRCADDGVRLGELVTGDARSFSGQGIALRYERFEAIADRLECSGRDAPVVVLLDDLQWADATSLDLLDYLVTRLRHGVLVVCTVRSLGAGQCDAVGDALAAMARRDGSRRLMLSGLTRSATRLLLPAAAGTGSQGDPATDVAADVIHRRSEGNPFYALELARLLDVGAAVDQEIPANVRDVVRRRLRQLSTEAHDLLRVGAILGRDIDLRLLPAAAGVPADECLVLLDEALVHRFLLEVEDRPGHLRFQHALIREVLVDSLTSLQRARLHLRAADAIEAHGAGTDDAEILADHLWHAVPVARADRAADALEHAADVALGRFAYASAETLLQRSSRLRRSLSGDEFGRRRELATLVRFLEVVLATRYFGGVDEGAVARASELAAEFGEEDLERSLFWFRWAGLSVGARNREAMPLARAFWERYHDDERPDVQAFAWEIMGTALWTDGALTESARHYDRAMELLERLPVPADGLLLEQRLVAWTFHATVHAYCGDWTAEAAYDAFDRMLEQWPPLAHPSICGFAATVACYLGDIDTVQRYCERALDSDPAFQFAFWGGQSLMQYAVVLGRAGRIEEAADTFAEGRQRYVAVGALSGVPTFAARLAIHCSEHGAFDVADALLAEARAVLATNEEGWNEPVVLLAEGVRAASAGDAIGGAQRLCEALDVAGAQGALGLVTRMRQTALDLHLPIALDATIDVDDQGPGHLAPTT